MDDEKASARRSSTMTTSDMVAIATSENFILDVVLLFSVI
jgi:hypothetical protein